MVYEVAIKLRMKQSRQIVKGTKHLLKDIFGKMSCSRKDIKEIGTKVLERLKEGR